MSHTIIPDIHADFSRLEWSIKQARSGNQIIFLGDLIDAGKNVKSPVDLQVLQYVRELIDRGKALSILGNHELNAILFHRNYKITGKPLRSHSPNNLKQHNSFIFEFGIQTKAATYWTEWMLETVPLWIEFDGFRAVHACWTQSDIDIIKERRPTGHLKQEDLEEVALKESPFAKAVERLVSGPEAKLPDPYFFNDNNGKARTEIRLSWWNSSAETWRDIALSVPNLDQLPDQKLEGDLLGDIYPQNAKPVFVGHYKMKGKPHLQTRKATSLDFPAIPCVYNWQGENDLKHDNLKIQTHD